MEKNHLLTKCCPDGLMALHPGMKDLSKTDMPERVRIEINRVVRDLFPIHSTTYTPEVALAKLVKLRFADTDNVIMEFFGNLAFRDSDHSPKRYPVKTTHGTMQVQKRAFRLDHLDSIFVGLANVVDSLLLPSIISKEALLRLNMKLRNAYTMNSCRTLIPKLLDA